MVARVAWFRPSNPPVSSSQRIAELLDTLKMGGVARHQLQAVPMAVAAIIVSAVPMGGRYALAPLRYGRPVQPPPVE